MTTVHTIYLFTNGDVYQTKDLPDVDMLDSTVAQVTTYATRDLPVNDLGFPARVGWSDGHGILCTIVPCDNTERIVRDGDDVEFVPETRFSVTVNGSTRMRSMDAAQAFDEVQDAVLHGRTISYP